MADTDPETAVLASDDAISVVGNSDSTEVTQFVGNLENKQEAIQEYVEALKLLRMELLPEDIFNAMHCTGKPEVVGFRILREECGPCRLGRNDSLVMEGHLLKAKTKCICDCHHWLRCSAGSSVTQVLAQVLKCAHSLRELACHHEVSICCGCIQLQWRC